MVVLPFKKLKTDIINATILEKNQSLLKITHSINYLNMSFNKTLKIHIKYK